MKIILSSHQKSVFLEAVKNGFIESEFIESLNANSRFAEMTEAEIEREIARFNIVHESGYLINAGQAMIDFAKKRISRDEYFRRRVEYVEKHGLGM